VGDTQRGQKNGKLESKRERNYHKRLKTKERAFNKEIARESERKKEPRF